jgi:hypothetical protein
MRSTWPMVEISHFLAEKTQREYDLVFDGTARTD